MTIFLDMDGVVNNTSSYNIITLPIKSDDNRYYSSTYVSAECVAPFIKLLEYCNKNSIDIVISSTWRLGTTVRYFNEWLNTYFGRHKLPKISGFTPRNYENHRGNEILQYVKENDIDNFIVIDDDIFDINDVIENDKIFYINRYNGITYSDVYKIQNYIDNYIFLNELKTRRD